MSKGNNGDSPEFAQGASGGAPEEASLQDELQNVIEEASAYLRRQLEERPLTVAAIALGAGVLLGLMMSKRR